MKLALKLPLRSPTAPRLSLRERYAALKGKATKAMRPVSREPEPAVDPDPILAAIATSHAATAAFDAFETDYTGLRLNQKQREREDALNSADLYAQKVVWQTVPTTPAGRLALVEFSRARVARHTHPNGDIDNCEYMLGLILDAFSAMVAGSVEAWPAQAPAVAAQAEPDISDPARLSAEQIDVTALDVFQLSSLFEAFGVAKFTWEGVWARPYSRETNARGPSLTTELGKVARFEEERAAWIMDCLEREIMKRAPEDDEQRDEILMVRTQQEFRGNQRIHDNVLLRDIARAWTI